MVYSVRDFAEQLNVTPGAIHNQLKRHSKELESHSWLEGRSTMLDEYAQDFIRERSLGKPPAQVVDTSMLDELEQLREENQRLYRESHELLLQNNLLLQEKATNAPLLAIAEQTTAERDDLKTENAVLIKDKGAAEAKATQYQKDAEIASQRLSEAEEQLRKLKKRSFWARLMNYDE